MVAVNEKGQLYFTFEKQIERMTFDQLEKMVNVLMKKRKILSDKLELITDSSAWMNSPLQDEIADYSVKIAKILIEMNYKAWEV